MNVIVVSKAMTILTSKRRKKSQLFSVDFKESVLAWSCNNLLRQLMMIGLDWFGMECPVGQCKIASSPFFHRAQVITKKVLLLRHLLNCTSSIMLPAYYFQRSCCPFSGRLLETSQRRVELELGGEGIAWKERAIIWGCYLSRNHRVPTWEVAECWNWIAWWSAI